MDEELQSIQRTNVVTRARRASGQPTDDAAAEVWERHKRHHIERMTNDVILNIRLCQSMCIYFRSNPAKFHPDSI